jgi:hypothetical protein
MSQQFFRTCSTVEETKIIYRNLAREYHPDLGGNEEMMKEINRQYHDKLSSLSGTETDGKTYNYKQKTEDELIKVIEKIIHLKDVEVSLIGYWIWILGDTKQHKDYLKSLCCIWHNKRKCWYYKPKGWGTGRSYGGSLEELARKYGCEKFSKQQVCLP